jgi:4-amino-4-deoxy-L-arabinose transferase-like glycosyltransferase
MMSFIEEASRLKKSLALILMTALYGVTRCTNLLLLPIFNDEAIYIHWASIIREDPSNLFISAIDGKTWLFMWLNSLTLGISGDILLSGRIISVVSGALTVAGIYLIGRKLYSSRVGWIASLIYLLLPFSLMHDRLALVDSLLTAFVIGLMVAMMHYDDLEKVYSRGVVLGMIMGLGFLTKTPFMLFFIFPPIAMLIFSDYKKMILWKGLVLAYVISFVVVAPYLVYTPPQKMPGVDKLFHSDRFVQDIVSKLSFQNSDFLYNLKEFGENLSVYVTWPLLWVMLASIVQGIKTRDTRFVFLLIWFLFPAFVILFFAKENYSRYFLFCIPALALMMANTLHVYFNVLMGWVSNWRWSQVWARTIPVLMLGLLLLPSVVLDLEIIIAPDRAGWTAKDRWQYVDSEFSGYGINEAVELFSKEAERHDVRIIFSPVWGNPEDALYLYLKDNPKIKMYSAWWTNIMPIIPDNAPALPVYKSQYQSGILGELILADLNEKTVYFVARDRAVSPEKVLRENPGFRHLVTYKKSEKYKSFSIYKR